MRAKQLKIKAARHSGLLIGCVLGLLSGLHIFGLAVGALLGYFADELIFTRRILKKGSRLMENPEVGIFEDGWTRIILSVALACGVFLLSSREKTPLIAGKKQLEDKIAATFGLGGRETGLIRQLADRFFLLFSTNPANITKLSSVYRKVSGGGERLVLLKLLIDAALGESRRITSKQNNLLKEISVTLEVSAVDFNRLRINALSIDTEAYDIIGVAPETSDTEIHKVYRRLAAQFHPDTGSDLDDDQRAQSEEAFLKIQDAYERIMADRSALRTEGDRDSDTD